jgi:hypothetical protein
MHTLDRWRWITVAAGALVLLWTIGLAVTHSAWSVNIAGVRLTSRDPFRSLIVGTVLCSIGLAGLRLRSPGARRLTACAALLAAITCVLGLRYGTFVAGGADAYGYVSQADLWTRGSLVVPTPLAAEATWPDAAWALTPLGYRPAQRDGWMAPIYPAGLPLAMAFMKSIAGSAGAYLVVPLLGGLLVWLTFCLGRTIHSAEAGLLAAVALAASSVFLFQLMLPMSDVPAAAWWLCAVVLALRPSSSTRLIVAGIATGLAVLTRPNLVSLAIPLAILVVHGASTARERMRRVAFWGVPAALGLLVVGAIDARLYGSPLQSGYGALDALYSPRYAWTNLAHFTKWLMATQTPFVLLGIVASSWLSRWCLAFASVVLVSYVWYLPFDNWSYLRFLLPAYPMLLATAAAALLTITARLRSPGGVIAAVGLLLTCVGVWQGRLAFTVADGESRYVAAAELARHLPARAVIMSNLHSGSLRYYADRVTVRYEWIGEDEYDAALRALRSHGHDVYAMLDSDEVDTFRQRYLRVADVSWLDRPPLAVANGRVFLYSVP